MDNVWSLCYFPFSTSIDRSTVHSEISPDFYRRFPAELLKADCPSLVISCVIVWLFVMSCDKKAGKRDEIVYIRNSLIRILPFSGTPPQVRF